MTEPESAVDERPWERLLELAAAEDDATLGAALSALSLDELPRVFARLTPEERGRVLSRLSPERAAEVLEDLPDAHAAEAISEIVPAAAADIVEELPSDERADLLGRLDENDADAILDEVEPETAEAVRSLLRHDPETAGGLMVTEFVAVRADASANDIVADLRDNVGRYADYDVQYLYAVDEVGRLVGVVPVRDVLLARPGRPVSAFMITDPLSVPTGMPLVDLAHLFEHRGFLGLPVVDDAGVLVGIVLRDDMQEARVDRAESDLQRASGIVSEELRSMPVWLRSYRRLSWLSVNVVLNVVAASVIALYQETLAAAIALAVFLPIISDMSGCSGNQAVAVTMRELSLGVIRPTEMLRVWGKELSVGVLNGLVLGGLIAAVAWLWKGNVVLGAVVGSALALNTVVAVSLGGTIPLVLRRLGQDPALASAPILTTVTDMCGFFLVLSLATLALPRLAG
jgi:magnesium transporter